MTKSRHIKRGLRRCEEAARLLDTTYFEEGDAVARDQELMRFEIDSRGALIGQRAGRTTRRIDTRVA